MEYSCLKRVLNLPTSILLNIFASLFNNDIYFSSPFLELCFVWLQWQDDPGINKWIWKCSFLYNYVEEFDKGWMNSLNYFGKFTYKDLFVSGSFSVGKV